MGFNARSWNLIENALGSGVVYTVRSGCTRPAHVAGEHLSDSAAGHRCKSCWLKGAHDRLGIGLEFIGKQCQTLTY